MQNESRREAIVHSLLKRANDVGVCHDHLRIRLVLLRDQAHVVFAVERALVVVLYGREIEQQVVFDGAGGIGLEKFVVAGVELGCHADVFGVGDLIVISTLVVQRRYK